MLFMYLHRHSILSQINYANVAQMSEEIQGAALVVPRSIMISIFLNGALGLTVLLITLFSLTDVEKTLNTPTNYPYMQVFLESTKSIAGATVMSSIIAVMAFTANIGIVATASRMCWSFCRDRGLPGWQTLQHVRAPSSKLSRTPAYSPKHTLAVLWCLRKLM